MGLSNKYNLKDSNQNDVASVIPLSNNFNSVAGLYKSFGIDENIITNQRLNELMKTYNLNKDSQTSIFDYL